LLRWRITKEGYEPLEIAPNPFPFEVQLVPTGTTRAGMVHIPPSRFELESRNASVDLGEHWIDRLEVTNRQFKVFADAGGYRNREYWKEPFRKDGRVRVVSD